MLKSFNYEKGYKDGEIIIFRYCNPQEVLPTANVMVDDIIQRRPALVKSFHLILQ